MNSALHQIERILSKPVAKPYRSKHVLNAVPVLDADGNLGFAPDDVENPKNWTKGRRWYITVISVLLVVNATFASSSPSGAIAGPNGIAKHFNVSAEAAGLVITLFLLGYCFGPLFWAPLSEFYGRRWIFYISFTGYLAFNFLCAFAPNFGSLLVGRFLTGTFVSAPLSNAPAVMVDIWLPLERGNAMALFAMMTFIGPAIGPVTSGFLELTRTWQWGFYVLLMLGGVTELLMFTIPETYAPQILLNKAKRIRSQKIPGFEDVKAPVEVSGRSLMSIYKIALTRPWIIMFDPISLLIWIYVSFVYALVYMLFTIYPIVFQQKRGWNAGVGELPLISTVIGAVVGGGIVFYNTHLEKKRIISGRETVPEDRLIIAMIGGIMFPIMLFWFSWSGEYNSVPWPVVCLGGVFLSTSIMLIFVGYLNYLTDSYVMYAASAMAANTVTRSAAGAAAPLFTQYMFNALGVGGGGSLIGGIACLLAPIPFVFYKYGGPIRKRSKFAPTGDKADNGSREKSATAVRQGDNDIESAAVSSGSSITGAEDGEDLQREMKTTRIEDDKVDDLPRSQDPEKDLEKGIN